MVEPDFRMNLHPKTFDELPISKGLKTALTESKFTELKPIQMQAIPHLLAGRNVLGASPTGSGKTLAFLIPVIELLTYSRARPKHGTLAIILSPSRELALQTYSVANTLMKKLNPTVMAVVGQQKGFKDEAYAFQNKGVNLVIATPGRLRKHLENGVVKLDRFQMLVIDEADRMLEQGFAEDLYAIFDVLKAPRQLALFSATLTADVEGLMNLNMTSPPIFCSPTNASVVETLEHAYAIVPFADRVAVLASILTELAGRRAVVFVGARKEAEFLCRLFNAMDINCDCLHGDLSQEERNLAFVRFNRDETHTLIATNVAARGLDFPDVDWSISVGPPDRLKDYIHRAGRTARNERRGRALLLLAPTEEIFAEKVKVAQIKVKKIRLELKNVDELKEQIRTALTKGRQFGDLALEAVFGFENTYKARPASEGISFDDVDMNEVRESFGLDPEGNL